MKRPEPARDFHEQFCLIEEWRRVRDARGCTGTHHVTYELPLPDGRILRTRISRPVDRTGYGPQLWAHILRDQLMVTEPEFWSCVLDKVRPERGQPTPPREALPADLVHLLVHRVGLSDTDVGSLSKAEAIERVNKYWETGS
ncbi:cytotoxic translational repressor of toxin-antitoxin stability system [Nocardia sp. NPDC058497]|uniref:cytotoxic translational repressor of toxin-antitoxin stability system n=1 Tax=Nocardia sp. NPDC058497 TaxID=3346529 RepID=UPI00364F8467